MRIKKLEIQGFKSFADRAVLAFGHGITGVVGPNGCGKSNIIDAVRWCMGEMSAKHLRGRAMQDVIFSGSDSRGPMGMAEVTLTFHNDGNVPPQYAAFSEISVTRRLHRDGESEYLVNKVPARLRDITDLFLGTGVGTRAYSIIEQGRIGFIVSSRPEDRRSLIEEVAGITKFKARKKAAERRLEATEQNLLRVNDIVAELDRQLQSLRRQAKKAERYRELKAELRDLDLHAAALEYLRFDVLEKVQNDNLEDFQKRVQDAQAQQAASESGLEVDKLRLVEEERRLQREQAAAAEIDTRLAALERDLTHWRQQVEDTTQRVSSARSEVEEAKTKISLASREREELVSTLSDANQLRERDEQRIYEIESMVSELQAVLANIDRDIEGKRKQALEHVHGAAQQRTLAQNLLRQRTDITTRLENAVAEQTTLTGRREEAEHDRGELAGKTGDIAKDLSGWRERLANARQELATFVEQAAATGDEIHTITQELNKKRSRLHSLEEIAKRFEGYSDGVRTLLGAKDKDGGKPALPGIRALVTDVLTARPEYERAIEAALGDKVQYLVVDSQEDGQKAIALLRDQNGGKSGFLPVAPRLGEPWTAMAVSQGILGTARTFVTVKPGYEDVAEYLLGDVLVVDTLETALGLWTQGVTDARLANKIFVTKQGDVVDRGGALVGGSMEGAGLLAKRREIRELAADVEKLTRDLEIVRARHDELVTQKVARETLAAELDKNIRTAELEKLELDKDLQAAEKEVLRLAERMEVLAYEISQRKSELTGIDHEERTALELAGLAESGQQEVEVQLNNLSERRRNQAADLEARAEELTTARVHSAAREEKLLAQRQASERLEETVRELGERIKRGETTIVEGDTLVEDLKVRIQDGAELLAETLSQAHERKEMLTAARERYETERSGMSGIEGKLRDGRKTLELLTQAILSTKMELQRLGMERQRLLDQVLERYDLSLLSVITDYHLRPLPGEAEHERRLDLERSIKAMGPINLTAIDECNEVETRHTFLLKQRDDLAEALDALRRAIQRINRASRERFQEAFDAVNEMFQQVFPRLFRGGEARLQLVESEDLLESGVEIIAMPPGKKPQSVSLLSGGEKALTATALVFSIFLIKPSPFCVLDEVDAPLDEANVGRFNEMLREISKLSQFIVITHNKHTMSEADKLYGITQEELGCSKVVSVDLSRKGGVADVA